MVQLYIERPMVLRGRIEMELLTKTKLCGRCALIKDLSLEERKSIAGTIQMNEKYHCEECDQFFWWNGRRYNYKKRWGSF